MAAIWTPPDIAPICAEQNAPLTQCSQTGFMFLALVTQLFGGSPDARQGYYGEFTNGINGFGVTSSVNPVETSIFGPRVPLGPTAQPVPSLGPLTNQAFGKVETHFYGKPDLQSKFEFQYKNPFAKADTSGPIFDFNFVNKGFYDTDAADSKKVTAATPMEKKEENSRKKRSKRQAAEEYDFIIVGAGSAGCVLANRLSEVKKWKILLLEAGPEEPDVTSVPAFAPTLARSNIDWNYNTQPEELTCRAHRGGTCPWIRGRTMGGSSAVNFLVYIRGNKRDYDEWADLGNHGWSYHDVLPYFKKAENNRDVEAHDKYHHAVGGPLNVERFSYVDVNTMMLVQSFKERGLPVTDFNGHHQIGTDIGQSTSKDGRRWSANVAYIRPIRGKRPNLHIMPDTFVTKVLIDPHTKTAIGVNYVRNGAFYSVYARKEVILSSGSINSPKILMLSGIGPKEHLLDLNIPVHADLRVGYNLQDHVTTDALIMGLSNKTSTLVDGQELMDEVYEYYSQHPKKHSPLATTATLNAIAFIKTGFKNRDVPDIQFHFDGRNVQEFYSDPTTYMAANMFPLSFYDGIAARPLLLTPKSRGFILLNSTDPVFGPPLIYPRFFTVKKDMDTLIEGIRFAVSLEETEAFRRSGASYVRVPVQGCVEYPWGTYEYFACLLTHYTSTIYHPVGTCKMGPKWDHEAVVDPRLRVYGIKKLRVIDSSIMPLIVRGNTNAPTIMIGEKGSDMIKEEWLTFHQ
ncbi:glucose dehydrogenase [FAD, quinone]-like isoform X1 [Pectinophora gossypiella]|uniref:glucose dehydrogenase [FAD, quinone]-like isoform X1 n=1 Tax=Pectinophora gossypiella TaxID=13191 RepID=UPI00214EBF80|nr:glucose dehydrogenase [FAD, quinone]-like isoform X1 [Pectinophora gossypiella]